MSTKEANAWRTRKSELLAGAWGDRAIALGTAIVELECSGCEGAVKRGEEFVFMHDLNPGERVDVASPSVSVMCVECATRDL